MQVYAGQRLTASLLMSMIALNVVKGADQSVTSSTALVNDNALVLAVVANAVYDFECYLDYEGGAQGSSDIKWGWALPALATMRYTVANRTTGGAADDGLTQTETSVPTAGTAGAGNLRGVLMTGTLTMGGTAGNMQLQWAQNTSNGTATIVHAGSKLAAWRVS